MNSKQLFILIIVLICIVIFRCTTNPTAGNSSQTGTVIGTLYNPDGTPAANAKIYAIPSDHNPISNYDNRISTGIIDSTLTNCKGEYSFDSLTKGYYNLLGYKDNLSSFNDSIYIPGTTQETEAPPDTLKGPGSLHGVIKLQPGDNANTVFILIFGTYTWTAPSDSIGNFDIKNLADGVYHVKFLTTLNDYDPLDTNLTIRAGENDTISDTLIMPFKGIPVPTGLKLSYDTMMQIVTLTWNKCDTSLVKGYNVYRRNVDSNTTFVTINKSLITNTFYRDSSGIQDLTYEYKIAAVDRGDNEGKKSEGLCVKVVSTFTLISTLGGPGTGAGKFKEIGDIEILPDKRIAVLDYAANKIQILDSSGNLSKSWGQPGNLDSSFNGPISITKDDSDHFYILQMLGTGRVQEFDTAGNFLKSWIVGQYCRGIAYSANKLYVTSSNPPAIKIINLENDSIMNIALPNRTPSKICLQSDTVIYISDDTQKEVVKVNIAGNIIFEFGKPGKNNGEFISPGGIELSDEGKIFIADPNTGRIQVFSQNGDFITKLIIAEIPAGSNEVQIEDRPRAIVFEKKGNLLVADSYYIYRYCINLP